MTVYRPTPAHKTFRYRFAWRGRNYSGNTHQTTKADAELVEARIRLELRHDAGGITITDPEKSPTIHDWAKVFYADAEKRLKRPDALLFALRPVLRFWGRCPDDAEPSAARPYHNLRLIDPVRSPDWLLRFEQWLTAHTTSAQTRNHWRGAMRRMYDLALRPEYRQRTGLQMNPFAGLRNDRTTGRDVALTPAQVQAWVEHASYHVRLAVSIAALAPKLRLQNVLGLKWTDIDERYQYITVREHKTVEHTGRPMVSPISAQLRQILKDAKARAPKKAKHVVMYQGRRLKGIHDGVKAAAEAAGIPYGRTGDGATFHTLRHTASTLLGEDERSDPFRVRDAMGHADIATTMRYTHLSRDKSKAPLERLSKKLHLADAVMVTRKRADRSVAESVNTAPRKR